MKNSMQFSQKRHRGMTLLEVLISMLIIGLALAMSISMIRTANRFGDNAEYTGAALQQAQVIIDKMKANRIAAETYVFTGGRAFTQTGGESYSSIYDTSQSVMNGIPANLSCKEPVCSEAEKIAKADMEEWRNMLRGTLNGQPLLPAAQGFVVSRDNGQYEVMIIWRHEQESDMYATPAENGIRVNFSL